MAGGHGGPKIYSIGRISELELKLVSREYPICCASPKICDAIWILARERIEAAGRPAGHQREQSAVPGLGLQRMHTLPCMLSHAHATPMVLRLSWLPSAFSLRSPSPARTRPPLACSARRRRSAAHCTMDGYGSSTRRLPAASRHAATSFFCFVLVATVATYLT